MRNTVEGASRLKAVVSGTEQSASFRRIRRTGRTVPGSVRPVGVVGQASGQLSCRGIQIHGCLQNGQRQESGAGNPR